MTKNLLKHFLWIYCIESETSSLLAHDVIHGNIYYKLHNFYFLKYTRKYWKVLVPNKTEINYLGLQNVYTILHIYLCSLIDLYTQVMYDFM